MAHLQARCGIGVNRASSPAVEATCPCPEGSGRDREVDAAQGGRMTIMGREGTPDGLHLHKQIWGMLSEWQIDASKFGPLWLVPP